MSESLVNLNKIAKIEIRREKEVKYILNESILSFIPIISWFIPEIIAEGEEFYNLDGFCLWLRNKKGFTELPEREEILNPRCTVRCRPSLTFISSEGVMLGRKYFSSDEELNRGIAKIRENGNPIFIHFTEKNSG